MQRVDIVTFAFVALACVWDLLAADKYRGNSARKTRLKAAGLLLSVSVLPAGVFLQRSFSFGALVTLMAILLGGGAILFYWGWRAE